MARHDLDSRYPSILSRDLKSHIPLHFRSTRQRRLKRNRRSDNRLSACNEMRKPANYRHQKHESNHDGCLRLSDTPTSSKTDYASGVRRASGFVVC
jgi:hypothetical protein